MRPRLVLLCALAVLAGGGSRTIAAAERICAPGSPVVITGTVGKDLEGSFVLEPFGIRVEDGVNEISIAAAQSASFTPPQVPGASVRNTLDFGTRGPGPDAFRGWNEPTATFSAAAATRSYRRGPIEPGEWFIEIGVAAIVAGTTSSYTVTVTCRSLDPAPVEVPPAALRDPAAPVPGKQGPGWYAGDLHVHSNDSSDAPVASTVDAIATYARDVAKLDFFSLTDHNTNGHLDDLGVEQDEWAAKGLLIIPGTEVTTYRGHTNWHGGAATFVEYRTGTVWKRNLDTGGLVEIHPARSANEILAAVRAQGGLTQVNHPTQFNDPISSNICRGCAWSYSDTDWKNLVDSIEIQTGPPGLNQVPNQTILGPNPFTVTAILMWEDLLRQGARVRAVGASDDHRAGVPGSITQSPIGTPATVVYADSLSEEAILDGLRAGHAYVRFWGPPFAGTNLPHIELTTADGTAMMGDSVQTIATTLLARVKGGPVGQVLRIVHNGVVVAVVPVVGPDFTFDFPATGTGFWRIETLLGTSWQTLSNPIFLEPPAE